MSAFISGASAYSFQVFYDIKNTILRYDGRTDYCNYGYWIEGEETANPSAELVKLVASRLRLTAEDVLLDIGSGMGQPDIDIAAGTPRPKKIIGINNSGEQVAYTRNRVSALGLARLIEYCRVDAARLEEEMAGEKITCIMSIEALAEMEAAEKVIRDCYALLPAGGRISVCDVVKTAKRVRPGAGRIMGGLLLKLVSVIFNDQWREADDFLAFFTESGFRNVGKVSIGERVYPFLHRRLRERGRFLNRRGIPVVPRLFFLMYFYCLHWLYSRNLIDYVVVSAVKGGNMVPEE